LLEERAVDMCVYG